MNDRHSEPKVLNVEKKCEKYPCENDMAENCEWLEVRKSLKKASKSGK